MPFIFPDSRQKPQYVQKQFERLARRYDLANDIISFGMHRLWKAQSVSRLMLSAVGDYLDVCCGTGDIALRIAQRLTECGSVTGVDFSPGMLAVAKDRSASTTTRCKIKWLTADAQNLPFEDRTFDGAIISFGLRNLSDYERGIREIVRVVKPGGNVVNLDLGKTSLPVFARLFKTYFEKIVPLLGQIIQRDRDAYIYLPESAKHYLTPEQVRLLFEKCGLTRVRYTGLCGGCVALHWGTVA